MYRVHVCCRGQKSKCEKNESLEIILKYANKSSFIAHRLSKSKLDR